MNTDGYQSGIELEGESNSNANSSAAAIERADFTPAGKFAPGNSYAWPKGVSGNANGRRGSITDRINEQLDGLMPGDTRTRKQVVADVLVDLACGGNIQACREVLDRSEGKVRQGLDLSRSVDQMTDDELEQALIAQGIDVHALTEAMDRKELQLLEGGTEDGSDV